MVRYIIDEEELKELIYQSLEYNALICAHVHELGRLDKAIKDFISHNGNPQDTLMDIAEQELQYYEKYE